MLEGTDLYSAYAPLMPMEGHPMPLYGEDDHMGNVAPVREVKKKPSSSARQQQEPTLPPPQAPAPPPPPPAQPQPQYNPNDFNSQFNQYYDNEQRMIAVINELQKRNTATAPAAQPRHSKEEKSSEPSYFDRLGSKKKDVIKFLHSALIIVFALAVHFLIHHYFTWYVSNNDLSFERELMLRLLYPIGILFVAWNIMLIFK